MNEKYDRFIKAYKEWVDRDPVSHTATLLWYKYVDARDDLPEGTTHQAHLDGITKSRKRID